MNDIGVRLKEIRTKSCISILDIVAATGLSKDKLYYWEKGNKPQKKADYNKLNAYLNKIESLQELDNHAIVRLPLKNKRVAKPHFNGKANSGTVFFNHLEPELIVEQVNDPLLGKIEGIITVNGDNMEPSLPNGCRIGITRLNDFRSLQWGKCYYIIDKNWQGYVKRVYQGSSESCISLVSDHPDKKLFPSYELSWDKIETILEIVSCIIKF